MSEKTAIKIEGGKSNIIQNNIAIGYDKIVDIKDGEANKVIENIGIISRSRKWYMNPWLITILGGIIVLLVGGLIMHYVFKIG